MQQPSVDWLKLGEMSGIVIVRSTLMMLLVGWWARMRLFHSGWQGWHWEVRKADCRWCRFALRRPSHSYCCLHSNDDSQPAYWCRTVPRKLVKLAKMSPCVNMNQCDPNQPRFSFPSFQNSFKLKCRCSALNILPDFQWSTHTLSSEKCRILISSCHRMNGWDRDQLQQSKFVNKLQTFPTWHLSMFLEHESYFSWIASCPPLISHSIEWTYSRSRALFDCGRKTCSRAGLFSKTIRSLQVIRWWWWLYWKEVWRLMGFDELRERTSTSILAAFEPSKSLSGAVLREDLLARTRQKKWMKLLNNSWAELLKIVIPIISTFEKQQTIGWIDM